MSAQETVVAAELSNRREIPVTAFDFLDGAYRKAVNARRSAIALAGLMALGAVALGALSIPAWNAGTQAQADTVIAVERREQLLSGLGTAAGTAIDQEELILRYRSLTETYRTLVLRSPSAGEFVTTVSRLSGEAVASLRFGHSSELVEAVPGEPGDADMLNEPLVRPRILITFRGENIGEAVLAAEALRGSGLQVVSETRGGVSTITVGVLEGTTIGISAERLLSSTGVSLSRSEAIEAAKAE